MKFDKLSPVIKELRDTVLLTGDKTAVREKLIRQILAAVVKAMESEIRNRKTKSGLIIIEYHTEGSGIVGHSQAHGLESAPVSRYHHILARFTSAGGLAEITGGYDIYCPPSGLGNPFPRPRREKLDTDVLEVGDYVSLFYPKTQYEPFYSHKETGAIVVGACSVGNRLRRWRKEFEGIKIDTP